MAESRTTATRIDSYKGLPRIGFIDEKTFGLLVQIDFALRAVRDGKIGPYGALEDIIEALDDFAGKLD